MKYLNFIIISAQSHILNMRENSLKSMQNTRKKTILQKYLPQLRYSFIQKRIMTYLHYGKFHLKSQIKCILDVYQNGIIK